MSTPGMLCDHPASRNEVGIIERPMVGMDGPYLFDYCPECENTWIGERLTPSRAAAVRRALAGRRSMRMRSSEDLPR
jgi:hypothetical protein